MPQAVSPEGVFTPYSPPPIMGSPGTQLFSYTAVKPGAASITYNYFRCFDEPSSSLNQHVKNFAAGTLLDFCRCGARHPLKFACGRVPLSRTRKWPPESSPIRDPHCVTLQDANYFRAKRHCRHFGLGDSGHHPAHHSHRRPPNPLRAPPPMLALASRPPRPRLSRCWMKNCMRTRSATAA